MEVKDKVSHIAEEWIRLLPEEFEASKKDIKDFKQTLKHPKFATVGKKETGEHVMLRELARIPDTLYFAINYGLEEEEMRWFKSLEGQRWFVKKFDVFRVGEKV